MLYAITTVDNPYDPLDDFINWYKYDAICGYHTCNILAKFAYTSDAFSKYENELELSNAIDEIVSLFPNLYKKIERKE